MTFCWWAAMAKPVSSPSTQKPERTLMKAPVSAFLFSLGLALSAGAHAQHLPAGRDSRTPSPAMAAGSVSAEMTDGVVRKVDREAKKLTIRHGPIKNLDMP